MSRLCPGCGAPATRDESKYCASCGDLLPPVRQRWWKRPRNLAIAAGVVAVLAVASLLRAVMAPSPEEPVEELVAAMQDRDLERVLALIEHDVHEDRKAFWGMDPRSAQGLFAEGALDEGYDLPDLSVGDAAEARSGIVRAEADVPPPEDRWVPVSAEGSWSGGAFTRRETDGWVREWGLRPGEGEALALGQFRLPHTPEGPITIAGMDYEVSDNPVMRTFAPFSRETAPVGVYTVTYDHPHFETGTETLEVAPGETVILGLEVGDVREEMVDEGHQKVEEYLDECEEDEDLRPIGCPFGHDPGHFFPPQGGADWEILTRPEIGITTGDVEPGSHVPSIAVETTEPGTAEVTFNLRDQPEQTHSVDFEVGGTIGTNDAGETVFRS
ncbi:hypothetical protein IDM40_25985 [Nocardiopsis sp. HNM0947]|uniref:Zinc ribbon domain-containing protein n=1 Tax=Nocardiopsis coralli TaxID=2772213 RepID=A0ABR9PE83_9ACTN|nr:hypothetical protein [Nocardiopsis coralli]MBE3002124.1 hypothetical protein [Nocardiopsis coralli]